MNKLNVVHHMNEFRSILSYASKIGFFFGAGTSCAFGLPNIAQLTEVVKNELDSTQKSLFEQSESILKVLLKKNMVTVEDILNYLRKIRELTKDSKDYSFNNISGEEAASLDKNICFKIFDKIRLDTEGKDVSNLQRFFAWLDAANRKFIKEIYTTNYDMLLEIAMEANRIPYFDGFTGAYEPFFSPESIESFPGEDDSTNRWIRLWKIHGSLNWMKKSAADIYRERIIRIGRVEKPENELMIYPSREKYSLSRKEPFIAYFDRLKNYLNRGEVVFIICGYSFGDEHINEIIFNALRNNSKLYVTVFCFDDKQVESMEANASSFLNLCVAGPTKVIANGVMNEWIYDNSDDQDLGDGMYWNKVDGKFLLGDFNALIDFLVENSGRKNVIEEIVNGK